MKKKDPIPEALIAPCGMNCGVCSRYLTYINGLKRSGCVGCRPRDQTCNHLFGHCTGINHSAKRDAAFCYECEQYPCKQIERIDDRYRKHYRMSMKVNLEHIQKKGMRSFLRQQYDKYRCERCGGLISTHNLKCFHCDTVTKLVDKEAQDSKIKLEET
jgi:hypothetical protein